MLAVNIEIWPFGSKKNKRLIDQIFIINDGTGDHKTGNYDVILNKDQFKIKNFDRSEGATKLVYEALKKIMEE